MSMQNTPLTAALTSLSMPLRDIARAMRAGAHASESLLKPATGILPAPIKALVEASIERADALGARVLDPEMPKPDEIALAQTCLLSDTPTLDQQAHLVRVLSYGMTEALNDMAEDWIVSEMRLALIIAHALQGQERGRSIDHKLAALASEIMRSTTVAVPGSLTSMPEGAHISALQIAATAPLIWLSLERDTQQDEGRLLHLCVDVARHVQDDLSAAFETPVELAAILKRVSSII